MAIHSRYLPCHTLIPRPFRILLTPRPWPSRFSTRYPSGGHTLPRRNKAFACFHRALSNGNKDIRSAVGLRERGRDTFFRSNTRRQRASARETAVVCGRKASISQQDFRRSRERSGQFEKHQQFLIIQASAGGGGGLVGLLRTLARTGEPTPPAAASPGGKGAPAPLLRSGDGRQPAARRGVALPRSSASARREGRGPRGREGPRSRRVRGDSAALQPDAVQGDVGPFRPRALPTPAANGRKQKKGNPASGRWGREEPPVNAASHLRSPRLPPLPPPLLQPWPVVDEFLKSRRRGELGADVGCGNGKYMAVNPDVLCVGSDRCGGFDGN
ncbi:MAG: hypothetical protein BJ554DRAFT_5048 [Olpidium bornovanus]|uniref:Uncharacterized protein n=1 Tax=Olpidium bornovanus TaxID=278681 RepID=A0A8H8DEI6_9FUNG|nr:MAG: hypothetical protein BJ554DRAFT_5048 [Olpidium bornovanus]